MNSKFKSALFGWIQSADAFMHANPSPLTPRFDFIAITGNEHDYQIEHIEDLYMPALRTYR